MVDREAGEAEGGQGWGGGIGRIGLIGRIGPMGVVRGWPGCERATELQTVARRDRWNFRNQAWRSVRSVGTVVVLRGAVATDLQAWVCVVGG